MKELTGYDIPNSYAWAIFYGMDWAWWAVQHEKHEEMAGMVDAIDDPSFSMIEIVLINVVYEL